MSYDFEFYTSRKQVPVPPVCSAGCQAVLDGPYRVEEEDIAPEFLPVVGKKRILFRIHLEGTLTVQDQAEADRWLRRLVADTKGVLIDVQADTFETAQKSGQIGTTASDPQKNRWMNLSFRPNESFYDEGFEKVLARIAAIMPGALPARFGPYEPLQHRTEDGDMRPVVAMFRDDPNIILRAGTPFGAIMINVPGTRSFSRWHPRHFVRREFLLACISFELRPKIFRNPMLYRQLSDLFGALCVDLDVIYGDITNTDHFSSWFWRGLPDRDAHSVCIGPDYSSIWPEFVQRAHPLGAHHYIICSDRFGNAPPRPPAALRAPDQSGLNPGGKPDYAPVFPFDYVFDYDRYVW